MKYTFKCYNSIEEANITKETLIAYSKNKNERVMFQNDIEYFGFQSQEGLLEGRPLVCVLYKDNSPVMFSLGVVHKDEVSPSITYLKLKFINFKKKCYQVFQYGVFHLEDTIELSDIFIKMLLSNINKYNVDYVFFDLIRKGTALSDCILKIKNPLIRDFAPNNEKHFMLKVPESLAEFLASKDKQRRSKFNRIIRKIESEYKGNCQVKIFTEEKDVEQFFRDAESVAQKSQLRAINVGFKSTKTELTKKKWLAKKGYLRSYILYLNGLPVCFMEGINYKRHYFGENTGYDMEYEDLRIGTYLKLKLVEDISQTKCADFIDFGFGADIWKKRFSSKLYEEMRIKLYVPKFSNLVFSTTITFFAYLNRWSRKLLRKLKLYKNVRKYFRSIFAMKVKNAHG